MSTNPSSSVKIGINGFGRIGRRIARLAFQDPRVEITAINDLGDIHTLAHLFRYDSAHGTYPLDIHVEGSHIVVNGRKVKVTAQKDPTNLPWGETGTQIVHECTGIFRDKSQAMAHLNAGAKKAIISAPGKNVDLTVCMGVNHESYDPAKHDVLSNASCTTNCLAPVVKVLDENFGMVRGMMTTVHSYTSDQRLLDAPHSDLRRARAAALSQIPTTTGAAKAIGEVLPHLKGKLDGLSIRVPTPNVSLVDLTCEVKKATTLEAVNQSLKSAAEGTLKGILGYEAGELVSCDFNGNTNSSTVDAPTTAVIDGTFVKVVAWYDNESGFSARMIDLSRWMAQKTF